MQGFYHGGTKCTYLLHFFSFLDQTYQIDYDCLPNDIKFSFDAKCQIVTSHVSSRQNGMKEGEDSLDDVEKKSIKESIHAFNKSGRHLEFSTNDVIRGKIIHLAKMATKDESSVDVDFAVCSHKKGTFLFYIKRNIFLYNVFMGMLS